MRVCLVTTGQPSTNPRLVKEADALTDAGCDVRVIGAHWADWADASDRRLLATRSWPCRVIEWRRDRAPVRFWWSRVRHFAARQALRWPAAEPVVRHAALSRLTPDLMRAARAERADLYIAHNLGALPAAALARSRHGGRLGFDAEDFHRGEFERDDRSGRRTAVMHAEARYLPLCDYVTAASPAIAAAYARYRGGRAPDCILNVFSLADRPEAPPPFEHDGPIRLYWFSQTIGANRGLEDVIEAMGRLAHEAVELHLRGDWQPGYRDAFTDRVRRAGVSPSRIRAHAPADAVEMVRLASSFDVGLAVEPGRTENSDRALSNKMFAYLLAGLATAATTTTGQSSLLPELGAAAQGYRPGDVDALTGLLRRWIGDRAALARARARAWHLGTTRFNWEVEKRTWLGLVDEVMAPGRVPARDRQVRPRPLHAD